MSIVSKVPAVVAFEVYKGDRQPQDIFVKEGAVAYNLTGWTPKMDIKSMQGSLVKSLTVGSGLTVDATAGKITHDFLIDFAAGDYRYDLQITAGTVVKTLIRGSFSVIDETTT